MKYKYKGPNKMRRVVNDIAETALILYAILGSCGNLPMTGHLSADLYLGYKHPTSLEKYILDKASNHFNFESPKWMEAEK